jgi:putative ATPase
MALTDTERGYGDLDVQITEDALAHLIDTANGDARSLLNALELAVETTEPAPEAEGGDAIRIDLQVAEDSIQQRAVLYDKEGDAHFDTISAFIKSLRGSDPDAALYWLARMIYAGEDPRFILRRMLIFAAEDVGLADPQALQVVQSAATGFDYVGMPEGQFMIAEACLYLATAPKSNTAFSYFDALDYVREEQTEEVPNPLKDANRDKEGLGHGKGYKYPHAYREHYTPQQYLPDGMQGTYFYEPSGQGYEQDVAERLAKWRERDADEEVVKRAQRYAEAAKEED